MLSGVLYVSLIKIAYTVSTDCPGVITFAKALNLDTKQVTMWNQLQTDCCTVSGVGCSTGPERVTSISWTYLGLDGTIQSSTLPSTLVSVDLSHNTLSGTIPTISFWPSSLYFLEISHNNIVGPFPLTWPLGMKHIYAGSNQMNGSVTGLNIPVLDTLHLDYNFFIGDLPSFSNSAIDFDLSFNQFTGTLSLNKPTGVRILNNWIADVIIADTAALVLCDLSNNALLGNPRIDGLTFCTKNGLFNPVVTMTKSTVNTIKTTATLTSVFPLSSFVTETMTMLTSAKNNIISSSAVETTGALLTTFATSITNTALDLNSSKNNEQISPYSMGSTMQSHVPDISTHLTASVAEVPNRLQYNFSPFDYVRIGIHLAINAMFVATVISKAPIKRTVKNAYKKKFGGKEKGTNSLDM